MRLRACDVGEGTGGAGCGSSVPSARRVTKAQTASRVFRFFFFKRTCFLKVPQAVHLRLMHLVPFTLRLSSFS